MRVFKFTPVEKGKMRYQITFNLIGGGGQMLDNVPEEIYLEILDWLAEPKDEFCRPFLYADEISSYVFRKSAVQSLHVTKIDW